MVVFNLPKRFILLGILLLVSNGNANPSNPDTKRSSVVKDSSLSKSSSSSAGSGKYNDVIDQIKRIELELEDERSSRSDFQERLANASILSENNAKNLANLADKVETVENSVNSDTNFWNSSDTCGGVVIAQYGKLSYSQSWSYTFAMQKSSCIWTVRANYRSKIKVSFTAVGALGFATEFFIAENGTHTTRLTTLVPLQNYLFNGPVILISFQLLSASGIIRSSSATIVFEGLGLLNHQDTEFEHYHYQEYTGSFNQVLNQSYSVGESSVVPKKSTFSTVVINTHRSNLVELQLSPLKKCMNSTLKIQQGFDLEPQHEGSCCNGTCPQTTHYTLDGWFTASYSSLKPQESLKMNWKARWNHSDSAEQCGGVLMGKTGKISYKRSSNYFNNERCVWVIYPFPKSAVRVTNVLSGMESTYDHLTITEIDKDVPHTTELLTPSYLRPSNFSGRVVLVTFYTDSSVVRQGFELTWEAIGPSNYNRKLEDEQIIHKPSESNRISIKREPSTSKGFILYLVSSLEQDGSSLELKPSNLRSQDLSDCNRTTIRIHGSQGGHVGSFFNNIHGFCNSSAISLRSPDGIGSLFVENPEIRQTVELDLVLKQNPPDATETSIGDRCGGVLHATSGRLSYKLEDVYINNERCIWIIHSPTSQEIVLTLLKDGFEECCDYILVNTVNPENGTLNSATTVITRENSTRVFKGPLVVVSFRSDSSVTGKGFALQYTGRGNLTDRRYTYHVAHRDAPSGSYEYPQLDSTYWDNGNGLYKENEILVVACSSPAESGEGTTSMIFNVTIEDVVLGLDENCNSDTLNFYSSPSREGFHWAESYPKHKCTKNSIGHCGECSKSDNGLNDTVHHEFGSGFKAFLAIYKPVRSEFTNQSFHAHWDVAAGCGGVIVESSGRIAYKLGGKYKNSEQCIWTVHSPGSSKIRFNMISNGFEPCCDYVLLNSLDTGNGTLGSAEVLSSEKRVVTMDGPVVFVTFRSDGSVTGEGFSLTFAPLTPSPPGNPLVADPNVYHFHSKRRNSSFLFPPIDEEFELIKDSVVTFAFSPESVKNESFIRHGTKLSVDLLHLGFDNETCASDTLKFFNSPSRLGYNITKSYALDLPEAPSCPDSNQTQIVCKDCPGDQSRTQQLTISSTTPAFIAIFKSNSDSTELIELDGNRMSISKSIRISWTDLPRPVESIAG